MADLEQFFEFAGHENRADAPAAQFPDDVENLLLGLHVNAARRLVEEQYFRLRIEPLADHDFLLIAAAERRYGARRIADFNAQFFHRARGHFASTPVREYSVAGEALQRSHRDVIANAQHLHQPLPLAVFRSKAQPALFHGLRRRPMRDFTFNQNLSGVKRLSAKERHQKLAAPRTQHPRDAEYFAALQRKTDVVQGILALEAAYFENGFESDF